MYMLMTLPSTVYASTMPLDEFANVASGILDHGNGGPGPDGGFGPREGNVRSFQPLDHLVQIGDDKGQVMRPIAQGPIVADLAACDHRLDAVGQDGQARARAARKITQSGQAAQKSVG